MKKHILTLASALLVAAVGAHATVVVKWGADNDVVTAFISTNRNSLSLNADTANNPAIGTGGYYQGGNPADRSAIFYNTVYNSTDGNSRLQIPNSITPNPLTFDGSNGTDTSSSRTFAGITLWQKADGFLSSDTLSWDNVDTITWDSYVNASTSRGEARFVVRNGASDFYVSNDLGVFTSASAGVADKGDVSGWFNYTPTTSILTIGSAATPTLNDITAIGYLFVKVDTFTSISHRTSEFTVTAVPEPATYALLAGMGVLGLVLLRRRAGR